MIDPTTVPALLIALPIIVAALPLVAGIVRDRLGWWIALGLLTVEALLAAMLAVAVVREGEIIHPIGGFLARRVDGGEWASGIELVADPLSTFVVALIAVVALAVLATTRATGPRGNAFYSGYLLLTGGLMGVALTGDLFNMFVFLEITGLATYALVASDRSAESAVAALKYLIIGTMGASLFLVGVGYLYVATGILNMQDLSAALGGGMPHVDEPLYESRIVVASFGFIAVGLATKAAIYPLHTWQPDAYAAAPDSVTTYISALASTVAAYALARVALTVYTPEFFAANPRAAQALLAFACVSIVAGTVLAVMQRRIKRMLAYSSVSQFGLILAAIGIAVSPGAFETTLPIATAAETTAGEFALFAIIIHLVGHGLMKGALFAAAGGLAADRGARTVREYAGLAKTNPVLSGCFAVLLLALVGVPPSVGFIGKWYVGLGAVAAEAWPVVVVLFFSTLLTLTYAARLLERLYFTPIEAGAARPVAADGGPDVPEDSEESATGTEQQPPSDPGGTHDGEAPGIHDGESPGTDADPAPTVRQDGASGVAFGTVAIVVTATVVVVGLGFVGGWFAEEAIAPFIEEVIPNE